MPESKEKRSSPLLYAKAPFRRLGSVLRGTKRPSEFHLWQLRWETVPSGLRRSGHRLPDTPRRASRIKGKKVTASSRLFRSLRLLHNRQLAVLVSHPQPLKGRITARETKCQRDRQCPESAIIT